MKKQLGYLKIWFKIFDILVFLIKDDVIFVLSHSFIRHL